METKLPFEPLGYRFELTSSASPVEVRASIRQRTRGWFDTDEGPRGWIVGPVICLWSSAFNQHGPMLIGYISRSQSGTRIMGRAGSDLNGTLLFAAVLPLIVLLALDVTRSPDAGSTNLLFPAAMVAGIVLIFCISHLDRHDADPLVAFLEDAVVVCDHP